METSKSSVERRRMELHVTPEAPWLGLRSYTEDVSDYFFGRNRETLELYERVLHRPLTVLFGKSGLGKTSVLQAGLIPRLRESGYFPILIRLIHTADAPPLETQVVDLVQSWELESTTDVHVAADPPYGLWQLFHDPHFGLAGSTSVTRDRIVLIFDQFEEVFTQGEEKRSQDAVRFIEALACLVENRPPAVLRDALEHDDELTDRLLWSAHSCRVLLTLRDDFLHRLERLRQQMPSLMDNRMELRPLSGTQAVEAVYQPGLKRTRAATPSDSAETSTRVPIVAHEMACRIVRFVAKSGEDVPLDAIENIEPPFLSLMCEELNMRRLESGEDVIHARSLRRLGQTVLLAYYERCLADQPHSLRTFVEEKLLSESGFREAVTLDTAVAELGRRNIGAPESRLRALVNRRLLVIEERRGVARVELTHDILASAAKESRDARRTEEKEKQLRTQSQRRWRIAIVTSIIGMSTLVVGFIMLASWGWSLSTREELVTELLLTSLEQSSAKSVGEARYKELKKWLVKLEPMDTSDPFGFPKILQYRALMLEQLAELVRSAEVPDDYVDDEGRFEKNDEPATQPRTEKRKRLLLRALKSMREYISLKSEDSQTQRITLSIRNKLSVVYLHLNQPHEALKQSDEATKTARTLAERNHYDAQSQSDLRASLFALGDVYLQLDRTEEAVKTFEEALKSSQSLVTEDPDNSAAMYLLFVSHNYLGHAWNQQGDTQKAIDNFQVSLDASERELAQNKNFFEPYDLACFHSLQVLLHTLKHPQPTEPQQAERQALIATAIQSLQDAIDGGYREFDHMKRDRDLNPLRGLPEFEALFPGAGAEPKPKEEPKNEL